MAFIDDIKKVGSTIGKVVKDTYGPLAPLEQVLTPGNYRYPLDVGNTQRYPHTVEFQTWLPKSVPITDMGVIQAGQDKLRSVGNNLGAIDFINKGTSILNKGLGKVSDIQFNMIQNTGFVEDLSETPKVNRNQRWNDRVFDFIRRAEKSDMITMYLPQGTWNDRINNSYQQQSMTEALGALGAVVDVASSVAKATEQSDEFWKSLGNAMNGPAGMEALGKMAGGLGMDGKVIRDAGLNAIGYALNPQFEMLYNGTDLREFQFDFVMTPRNQAEAEMIYKIVKKFKYHASPQFVANQGRYIVPPSYFDITFKFNGSDSEWLPQLSTCVLKSLDVDYTGGLEQWAAHADGSPVQVRLVAVFVELEMMHKSLRKKGY